MMNEKDSRRMEACIQEVAQILYRIHLSTRLHATDTKL
jgi:hypothetical protein